MTPQCSTLQRHCYCNSVYIFLFWEKRGLRAISTFMCLWAIYIFPGSVYIFPPAEQADPSWEYIIRSQTHESGNWDWGPHIPFLGIYVSNFRHFVFAVQAGQDTNQDQSSVQFSSTRWGGGGWKMLLAFKITVIHRLTVYVVKIQIQNQQKLFSTKWDCISCTDMLHKTLQGNFEGTQIFPLSFMYQYNLCGNGW